MNESTKLLTIGIPSYHRPEQIRHQIGNILSQLQDCVEVVIFDNCSPVPIESLFDAGVREKIRIVRNVVNVGADANIAKCFENCRTQWLWTLGDDDYLLPDALEKVLALIRANPDACFINAAHRAERQLTGFYEFANDLTDISSYGNTFFISKCIYNMDQIRPSLIHLFRAQSSMVAPLVLMLKHLEEHPSGRVIRCTTKLFEANDPPTWCRLEYLKRTLFLFDFFDAKKTVFLKRNLFRSIVWTQFHSIILFGSSFSWRDRVRQFWLVNLRYGIVRSFVSLPNSWCLAGFRAVVPNRVWAILLRPAEYLYGWKKKHFGGSIR